MTKNSCESSTQEKKATDKRDEASQALEGIQITDSRFTNRGNIFMNFDKNTMDEAAENLKSMEQISIKSVEKMKPKIMISDVQNESREKVKETILDRSEFLHTIQGVENKTELNFSKPQLAAHFEVRPDCGRAD